MTRASISEGKLTALDNTSSMPRTIMSSVALDDCGVCGQPIEGDSAAVGLSGEQDAATWVPFVEDLRTTGLRLVHPACFGAERGVEALVDVVHENDRRNRHEFVRRLP